MSISKVETGTEIVIIQAKTGDKKATTAPTSTKKKKITKKTPKKKTKTEAEKDVKNKTELTAKQLKAKKVEKEKELRQMEDFFATLKKNKEKGSTTEQKAS